MAENCPSCGANLVRCEGCGAALPVGRNQASAKDRGAYCNEQCKGLCMRRRYNHLIALGYTWNQAHRGRSSGAYERLVRKKEKEQCNASASGRQETPTSGS